MKKFGKNSFILLIFFTLNNLYAQDSTEKRISVNGIVGVKIFNPWADVITYRLYQGSLYFPVVIGGEFCHNKSGLSTEIRQTYFTSISARDTVWSDLTVYRKTTMIGLFFTLKRNKKNKSPIKFGLDYFRTVDHNYFTSNFGFKNIYWGISPTLGFQLKWINLEFRFEPDLYNQKILDGSNFSVQFLYLFGDKNSVGKRQFYYKEKSNQFNFIVGLKALENRHFFSATKTDDYSSIALTPELGLEYYFSKYNLSLDLRRNIWISLAGGDLRYNINGYSETLLSGITYYKQLKNKKAIKFNLSHAWIRDLTFQLQFDPEQVDFYPEKGIASTIAYPIRNLDLELRGIYAYYINSKINSGVVNHFDIYRISLGVVYRINAFSK